LRESIDRGLRYSRYGIVVLSKAFFRKKWTKKELAGLVARESAGEGLILPVWHDVDEDEVARFSPMLADRVAVKSSRGVGPVADAICRKIGQPSGTKSSAEFEGIVIPRKESELPRLARNLLWSFRHATIDANLGKKIDAVLDAMRKADIRDMPVGASEIASAVDGPSRFDSFVATGQSGRASDVDFLMRSLVTDDRLATCKLVDYSLGLVSRRDGIDRIRHFLFEGVEKQRNYAALFFRRRGDDDVLHQALKAGRIGATQIAR
jgi:hypothetical protein